MLSWPALLVAPLLALTQLSIAYSIVDVSCETQSRAALHAVAALFVVLVAITVAMAWRGWRRQVASLGAEEHGDVRRHAVTAADGHQAERRPPFLAMVSLLAGALSLLVTIALWLPIWFLSPCY
jgi:hypothetical protein